MTKSKGIRGNPGAFDKGATSEKRSRSQSPSNSGTSGSTHSQRTRPNPSNAPRKSQAQKRAQRAASALGGGRIGSRVPATSDTRGQGSDGGRCRVGCCQRRCANRNQCSRRRGHWLTRPVGHPWGDFLGTIEAEEESEEEEEGTEAEFEESEEEEDTAGSSVAGPSSSAPPPSARRRKPSDQVTRSATIRGRTVACDAICGGQGQFLAHIAAHLTKHPDDGIQTDKCCPHWL